jgi:hypothetical protein
VAASGIPAPARAGRGIGVTTETVPKEELAAALTRELVAYLESGETDLGARARLEALPGGAEMLARALKIRAHLVRIRGQGGSLDEFLQWKQEEREAEAERDRRRDAQCS